jgi:hypothetical protein
MAKTEETKAWRRVRAYVGGATRGGVELAQPIHAGWVRTIASALSELSGGGCTMHAPAVGCWRGVAEPVQIVEALVPDHTWRDRRASFEVTLQRFLAATCQDAVRVTADWLSSDEVSFVEWHDSEGVVSCG